MDTAGKKALTHSLALAGGFVLKALFDLLSAWLASK